MKPTFLSKAALALACATLPLFGFAQEEEIHPIDEQLNQCLDATESDAEMVGCVMTAYRAWDNEIADQFSALSENLPDALYTKLNEAQTAWIAYRQKEFEFNNDFFSGLEGTSWSISSADWKMTFTRNRAMELKTYNDILSDPDR